MAKEMARQSEAKAKYADEKMAARRAAANSAMVGKARTTNLEENRKALAKKKAQGSM